MIGNVIDVPFGVVTPSMVGTADGISFNSAAADICNNQHGAAVFAEVRAHVLTVGIQHDRGAALAPIDHEVTTKKGDAYGLGIDLMALGHNEPAPGVGIGPQTVFSCCCHGHSPSVDFGR